jgi:heme-degrading monooxygenase HmoA
MIKRFVKMQFRPDQTEAFIQVYESSRHLIRAFEGCEHVELLRDAACPEVFFTFSRWQSEAHLEAYRASDLFKGVWAKTKVLFAEKAQAWTVKEVNFP